MKGKGDKMTKFEYRAVNFPYHSHAETLQAELNEFGRNGWELVSFSFNPERMPYYWAYAIFKRPLP